MAKRLDQILVVDVESTCWEGPPPPGQRSEIIEIGLCPVETATLTRLEKRSILVQPTHSKISEFCTRLTTLTDDHLTGAETFDEAIRILRQEYRSDDRLWASWGDYDRRQFERVCADQQRRYPFGISHLNVKSLFAVTVGAEREMGVPQACEMLEIPFEGTLHRGGDDAWNIAGLLCRLLRGSRDILKTV